MVPFLDRPLILLGALLLDALIGDPGALWRMVPHPVAAMGWIIDGFDRRFNLESHVRDKRRWFGAASLLALIVIVGGIFFLVSDLFRAIPGGWLMELFIAAVLIAQRDLYDHVNAVWRGFEAGDIELAREAVSQIVGRDPETLDKQGLCRAAIESLSENISDGVVAPVFYYLLAGLPGIAIYKAVNTADSMIGYKNERYEAFGYAAAKLDDLLNFIPARLTGLLIIILAWADPRADGARALRTMMKDARKHRSPNAGWPEAAMAGALDVALNGPRHYGGKIVQDHWLNETGQLATPHDIRRALDIMLGVLLAQGVLIMVFALVVRL